LGSRSRILHERESEDMSWPEKFVEFFGLKKLILENGALTKEGVKFMLLDSGMSIKVFPQLERFWCWRIREASRMPSWPDNGGLVQYSKADFGEFRQAMVGWLE
jgi:hypothetical protein